MIHFKVGTICYMLVYKTCLKSMITKHVIINVYNTWLEYMFTVHVYNTCLQYIITINVYNTCLQYMFLIHVYNHDMVKLFYLQ